MVEVEIGGLSATIAGYAWIDGDEPLLTTLAQDAQVRPKGDYDPFPALTIANEAIARYGGRIVSQEPPEHVPGRVY